jgi:hypothetical protein
MRICENNTSGIQTHDRSFRAVIAITTPEQSPIIGTNERCSIFYQQGSHSIDTDVHT